MTSPKLKAVRFRDGESATDDSDESDPRTVDQLAFDGMLHLLVAGADVDPSELLGTGAPVVKLIVTVESLEAARAAREEVERAHAIGMDPAPETLAAVTAGHGFLEGQLDAVSISTIQRALEVGTSEVIVFTDRGVALEDAGISNRGSDGYHDEARGHLLFTRQQKSILAVRDGGCRWPGCDRPPSWCEAHHIRWWRRHNGSTRVDNGILLCKHHHLLLHNNGWEIERPSADSASTSSPSPSSVSKNSASGIEFVLIPPASIDATRTPRPMPSKSAAWNAIYGRRNGAS